MSGSEPVLAEWQRKKCKAMLVVGILCVVLGFVAIFYEYSIWGAGLSGFGTVLAVIGFSAARKHGRQ